MNAALVTTPAVSIPAHRVYNVLLGKKAEVEAALAKLAKRCEKKNLDPFAWSWGKAFTQTKTVYLAAADAPEGARRLPNQPDRFDGKADFEISTTRVPLTLETARPHYAGWTFIATLQHLEGENIVRAIPGCVVHADCQAVPEMAKLCIGGDLPEMYRTRGPVCDHCKFARRRNDTYVLRHDRGQYAQVGSTCIADFLGSDEATMIAAKAEVLALAASCALSGEEGYGGAGGASAESGLDAYLAVTAWCVRTIGWTSRTAAWENSQMVATADVALSILTSARARDNARYVREDADVVHAEAALAWAEGLTDDAIAAESGDYLHNLRAVARTGLVSNRTAGIAASTITAYDRVLGRERQKAERAARPTSNVHVGTVGDRVVFGATQETNKKGEPKKGSPVAVDAAPLTLDFVTGYQTDFGYTTVLKFRTAAGACVVWKASSTELGRADVGKRFVLIGAIKAHDEYKGEKQTQMARCYAREVGT